MVPAGGSGRGARSARSFPGADEQRCTSIRHLLRLLSRFYLTYTRSSHSFYVGPAPRRRWVCLGPQVCSSPPSAGSVPVERAARAEDRNALHGYPER